jgi:hypothetical protein
LPRGSGEHRREVLRRLDQRLVLEYHHAADVMNGQRGVAIESRGRVRTRRSRTSERRLAG